MNQPKTVKLLGIAAGKGGAQPGAEDGPFALRHAGLIPRIQKLGHEVEDLGDIPGVYETRFASGPADVNYLTSVLQVCRHAHACIFGTRPQSPEAFDLIIGGDHSLAIGALAGLSDASERLGLLWFDAHADFNTPLSSPSGNVHGMSLAVACGRGHRDLRNLANRAPMIDENDVYVIGCRDLDPGERDALLASDVHVLGMPALREQDTVAACLAAAADLASRCDHVHLSFDIDVIRPEDMPATGTPVPHGLGFDESREVLRALGRQAHIASAEVVEYNPALDPDGRAAEQTIQLIEALLSVDA